MYWGKFWVRVFFELLKGMTEGEQAKAMERLRAHGAETEERPRRG
jgi:hypothetical protein